MNSDALERRPPPPMSRGMRIAMALELALVTDQLFALPHWSSVVALVLCVPYYHFSATRAALLPEDA